MTFEKILELAQKYGTKQITLRSTFNLHDGSPTGEFHQQIDWKFGQEDLIAFAKAIIEAERESSDEPMAWLTDDGHIFRSRELASIGVKNGPYPLYRHPPPARKLTDEEITEIMLDNGFKIKDGCDGLKPYVYQAVRAIERRINGEEE